MNSEMKSPFTGGAVTLHKEPKQLEFRKDKFTIQQHYYKCVDTGEEFSNDELDQINVNQLYNQYRERYGLPFPDDIREIREQYGLSAAKMSEILGFGTNSYRLYESGEIPTVANGRLILAAKDPEEFRKFLIASSNTLSEKEFEKYKSHVDKLILGNQTQSYVLARLFEEQIFAYFSPNEFTGYKKPDLVKIGHMITFLSRFTKLWKTKLNKLLFYCDFLHFQKHSYAISGAAYRAIKWGPVPSEYERMFIQLCDDDLIKKTVFVFDDNEAEVFEGNMPFNESLFRKSELNVMQEVGDKLKNLSTQQLIMRSHKEKAWIENKDNHEIISFQKYGFDLNELHN